MGFTERSLQGEKALTAFLLLLSGRLVPSLVAVSLQLAVLREFRTVYSPVSSSAQKMSARAQVPFPLADNLAFLREVVHKCRKTVSLKA